MIELDGVTKTFVTGGLAGRRSVMALRDVSLSLSAGGVLAVIGESGSGKTTLGRIVASLERCEEGRVSVEGRVQYIHQDPYAALNPTRTVEQTLRAPLGLMRREGEWAEVRARELLEMVGLRWRSVLNRYPHELSGGQRQRVVIARALTVEPRALVADEAVSMVDVSLRLGILDLLRSLRDGLGVAVLFITHDMATARYVAQGGEIAVLYRGEVVERGPADALLSAPLHPYTQALLSAVPVLRGLEEPGPERFVPLRPLEEGAGAVTNACPFVPRCPFASERCAREHPQLVPAGEQAHACFHPAPRRVAPSPLAG